MELLVVIAIIAVLAGLGVKGFGYARQAAALSRVKSEMKQLETAIQAYHKRFGFYPPDNPSFPESSPLYYELSGNVDDQKKADLIELGVKGFVNSAPASSGDEDLTRERANNVPNFLPNIGPKGKIVKSYRAGDERVLLLTVPVIGTGKYRGNVVDSTFNPWRYVSKNPTHNTESFDLWVEIVIGGKTNIVGNWKD